MGRKQLDEEQAQQRNELRSPSKGSGKNALQESQQDLDDQRHENEKKMLKVKTLEITKQAEDFEEAQRNQVIKQSYFDVETSPLKPKNPKNRGELLDLYKDMINEGNSPVHNGSPVIGGLNNSMDPLNSKLNYVPPSAGKRGKKSGTAEEEQKQDKERLKDIMMKLYEGHDNDEYTDEQRYLMMMADEDNAPELNPMIETLKGYLKSRLAYHKVRNIEEAVLINDILDATVKPNGENFGMSLKKIICATRCVLQNKQILLMDDDALIVPESPNLMDDVFNELPESTIISVVNDYENL